MSHSETDEKSLSRNFIQLKDYDENDLKVRIMQWNMLAQGFIPLDEFVYCPSKFLSLERRCKKITDEILHYKPDIICLQEADIITDIIDQLNRNNEKVTYSYYFLPKRFSPCLFIEHNQGPDGLAVIYRADLYELLKSEEIPLDDNNSRYALFCHFKHKSVGDAQKRYPDIYIICLHLKAKESCSEIRYQQGKKLMEYLLSFIKRMSCNSVSVINSPIFVCGDFNAEPEEPVIKLLQNFSSSACNTSYKLTSAYNTACDGKEPEFTTWKIRKSERITKLTEVCHTIDYIWYCDRLCNLLGVWSIPSKDEIGQHGLPTTIFPSDHLNLIADFSLPSCQ
ncbi:unnamed protein product [Trichobilharzia szidati]|nr:unnamed protein product [Trichobilharzia szidati]